ncbi:golgin subfamily A member 6-like protein 22 isoform X1 [Anopheles darlingi]|uniref:golgin subfamily A member 6-like protein 22 isoform X1 n=1 Tax=Anopheles darlingi TaxID=43151 RepID=UPI0021002B5B|nr:golgin subfamily A member 6-like protein 22 isoform X1 [Anopheles darlingi]
MDVQVDAMEMALPPIESFKNCEYHVRVSGTTELDRRVMSFVDNLWGFEVTGGIDQFEPLTVISVKREGLARRAGIRVNDIITKINDSPADKLTLAQAQELIAESGRTVKIFVSGDVDEDSEDEMTVDYWFKPYGFFSSVSDADRSMLDWEARMRANRNPDKWNGLWPWNDRKKVVYKESNCYMVPSVSEEKRERELKLRATEDQYEKHLKREREEAERKAEEQRKVDEARREEEERLAEEERFFQAFEAEQKKRQEEEAAARLQQSEQAEVVTEESVEPTATDAETEQYLDELMEQEKDLGDVSTDMIEPDDSGTGEA